ncbi:UNC93-like protein 3 isoform X5 [Lotus japonicus]|nr:UNC93-like protein 3 isoform X5 [Lotus japonicus]
MGWRSTCNMSKFCSFFKLSLASSIFTNLSMTCQGIYLTSTARSHATDNKLDEGAVIGDFNGEFWAVFALHQFIGNLITFALLNDGKKPSTRERRILLLLEASYFAPIFYWWTSLYVQ